MEFVPISELMSSSDVIVSGTIVDEVRVPGKISFVIRVDRELKGFVPESRALGVEIHKVEFICTSAPPLPRSLVGRHGLWFLDRRSNGAHRLLPVQSDSGSFTASYYRLPAGELPKQYSYKKSDALAEKVLLEMAAATEYYDGQRGMAERFLLASSSLYSTESRRVFERFARSSSPNIRVVGLAGLIREGDVDALVQAEQDMGEFARSAGRLGLIESIHSFRNSEPVALSALARIAADKGNGLYLRYAAASALAGIASKEALPHLALLLSSDLESVRDAAASGFAAYAADIRFEDTESGLIALGRELLIATAEGAQIRRRSAR